MSTTIPVLGMWQPWASLAVIGAKPYETRAFKIPDRLLGKRVMIHATSRACVTGFTQQVADEITEALGRCSWNHWLPRGVIIGSMILAETIPVEEVRVDSFGNYAPGRQAWRLDDVRPIDPHIPVKGRQMIGWPWTPPDGFNA